ncbi:sensor histidine kinase [Streptomyces sp. NPDC017993]|uniref:sensor histidine kinase n=1 Tax=Streptomyces sp. NPDC017993 TaxID=3365027 RepID=UPI00379F02CE
MEADQAAEPPRGSGPNRLAPKLAMTITTVVLCAFCFVAVTYELSAGPTPVVFAEAMLMLVTVLSIQLLIVFPRLMPRLSRYRFQLFLVQAVLTFLPFGLFKQAWMPLPGLLSGSALLILPDAAAWAAFGLIIAGVDALQFTVGLGWRDLAYTTVSSVLTGLVVFGMARLTDLVTEVHQSRAELARLAVDQERLRFARDLHDLLGYSLSTITLKCELANRLLAGQEDRVKQELTEILRTSRRALADVRAVASGYRDMSLEKEVHDAMSLLAALDIRTTTRIECGPLPRAADTVLATVLREGLANMLRHSKADRCTITAARQGSTVRLRLANDGVDGRTVRLQAPGPAQGHNSSGISNLATRVEALNGRLDAGLNDGWFVLEAVVEVPITDRADDSPQAAYAEPA